MFVLKKTQKFTKLLRSTPPLQSYKNCIQKITEEFIIITVRKDINHLSLSTKFSGTAPCGASTLNRHINSEDNVTCKYWINHWDYCNTFAESIRTMHQISSLNISHFIKYIEFLSSILYTSISNARRAPKFTGRNIHECTRSCVKFK